MDIGTHNGAWVDFHGLHPKRKLLSFGSNHLWIASQLREGLGELLLPPSWEFLADLISMQVFCLCSQLLWVHSCNWDILSSKYYFAKDIFHFWVLKYFYLFFHNDPCILEGEDVLYMFHLSLSTLQFLIPSRLINCGLWINHYLLLHKEVSS